MAAPFIEEHEMITNFNAVQDSILELLQASDIPNVWESSVPAGVTLPRENGVHLPYAVVTFGGQSPVTRSNQGIVSSREDLKWTTVAVECVGDSQRDARVVANIVRDLLEGYSPDPDWGELSEVLSGDYSLAKPDYDLPPVRYATGIVFNTNVNAVR